jgi:hypothetical protein
MNKCGNPENTRSPRTSSRVISTCFGLQGGEGLQAYDSYCGLSCGACGTLLATEKGKTDGSGGQCMGCKSELLARGCSERCLMRPRDR